MDYWHGISAGKKVPDEITVVVEIPKGSQNKYEYDKESGVFKLNRVLFSPFHYPGDYGMVPRTLARDGDPIDVLVMVNYPTYPGMLIDARPIGVLKMIDNEEEDDKILCVPLSDVRLSQTKSIDDMYEPVLNEIAHFFQVYKQLEGKKVKIKGWENAESARKLIVESVKRYEQKFGKK